MSASRTPAFPFSLVGISQQHVGQIVEREAQDMWELGSLLCEARAICDDPALSVLEGIEGKTGNKRFNNWISNYTKMVELNGNKRKMAMNLHSVFGHRRGELKDWKTSILYELAAPSNADVRSQVLRENPNGMKLGTKETVGKVPSAKLHMVLKLTPNAQLRRSGWRLPPRQ